MMHFLLLMGLDFKWVIGIALAVMTLSNTWLLFLANHIGNAGSVIKENTATNTNSIAVLISESKSNLEHQNLLHGQHENRHKRLEEKIDHNYDKLEGKIDKLLELMRNKG